MSLIKCSECGKEISDKANTCPSCGNPMPREGSDTIPKVEVELTSKKWKKVRLFGLLCLFGGLCLLPTDFGALGGLLMFGALLIGIVAHLGAWWTNG